MAERSAARRPVALFDLDGTLYRSNSLVRFAQLLCERGKLPEGIVKLLLRLFLERKCREGSYREVDRKIIRTLLMGLRGRNIREFGHEIKLVLMETQQCVHEFPLELLHTLKNTHDSLIITGSMRDIAIRLASHWGFASCAASVLETDAETGAFTGRVKTTPVKDKSATVKKWLEQNSVLTLEGSVGIGDTRTDIPMLEMVRIPIAFNPDEELAHKAEMEQWTTVLERKGNIYVMNTGTYIRFSVSEAQFAVQQVLHVFSRPKLIQ
jgi:HAD superfamily phosphoserine phosphatase-like hydrolase